VADSPRGRQSSYSRNRAREAFALRRQGEQLQSIARTLGVSVGRAHQLITIGQEIERRQASCDPWDELSARTRNALLADGCEPTPDGVRKQYRTICGMQYALGRVPNLGKKSIVEINDWLTKHGGEPIPYE
jgi:hypothetical protein